MNDDGQRNLSVRTRTVRLAILLCLWTVVMHDVQAFDRRHVVTLADGVLIDMASNAAYLMAPDDKLEAVNLIDGSVRWRSAAAEKPLTLVDGKLLAQARAESTGYLALRILDAADNGEPIAALNVAVDKGVSASIDAGLGHQFIAQAGLLDKQVLVYWQEKRLQVAATQDLSRKITSTRGAVAVDLDGGKAVSANQTAGAWSPVMGSQVLALNARMAKLPDVQFAAADDRVVLVSERQANAGVRDRYQWTFYDRRSGQVLGRIRNSHPHAPFMVVNAVVLYQALPVTHRDLDGKLRHEPLRLVAQDLQSGALKWSVPVRDTTYRGPLPP